MTCLPYLLAFFPMAMAFVCYGVGKKHKRARDILAVVTGVIECLMAFTLYDAITGRWYSLGAPMETKALHVCALGLSFQADGFRLTYALIAAFMWCMTLLLSPEYFRHYHNRNRYYFFNLLTMGATVGLFLTDDLFSTFIFFEIMSFASYPWVAHDQTDKAMRAAQTYLAVAVVGGMTTLMGLFLLYNMAGTLSFSGLRAFSETLSDKSSLYLPGALVFFGFAAKAGVFPMHIWLPKAHPVAPAPASALLSGILTKTGIFGILVLSVNLFYGNAAWGNAMLLLGVVTMFLGALLALFSVDLKRTLACSSMSQIGFIMVGVGMMGLLGRENALAAQGTVLHMVNHSLLKLVLFMAAGVIYMNTHKLNLNDIRGFGRKKPLLHFAFLMGVAGLSGVPLFNGYISKSLLHEGILEYVHLLNEIGGNALWYQVAEKIFIVTGGMTAAYMTKLYISIFWEKNADPAVQRAYDEKKKYMNKLSAFALLVPAILLPAFGMLPESLFCRFALYAHSFLRFDFHEVDFFSAENLLGAGKSLLIGGALYAGIRFFLMQKENDRRVYVDRWPKWLDLEETIYRPLVCKALPAVGYAFARVCDKVLDCELTLKWIPKIACAVVNAFNKILDCKLTLKAIPAAVTALTRALDQWADSVVLFLRRTLFAPLHKRKAPPVGTRWTWALGSILNGFAYLMNKTFRRKRPITADFVATFAAWREEMGMAGKYVTRSVSFGLLLLCAGLLLTLAYLLTM